MKLSIFKFIGIVVIAVIASCQSNPDGFKPIHLVKSAQINLNGNIDKVFPLFGAIEEKKWSDGWNPIPVYPESGTMQNGFVFQTKSHAHNELLTWVVSDYDVKAHALNYTITSPSRVVYIDIRCTEHGINSTEATITYQFTGLTPDGNKITKHSMANIFQSNLKDWESGINAVLAKSK